MKICLVSDSYPTLPQFGGIAVFTRLAAQSLAARGHEVHVILTKAGDFFDRMDGGICVHARPVHWIPFFGRWVPGLGESSCLAWALSALHRRVGFDVVEIPNWEGIGYVSALLPGPPVVIRLHTSMAESIAVSGRSPQGPERFLVWMEGASARLANAVVTHSEKHRSKLERSYGIRDVQVIPHGIVVPKLPERSLEEFAVLVVGPCNARKGAETLFQAIPMVIEQFPNAQFWLAGIAEDHPRVREFRARHANLPGDRVLCLGFVESANLEDLYARCAVYASASVYESFGLTFVEAMARGKPVVGCAVSAMPEIIDHEITGLLVPPNDAAAFAGAIGRLLCDDDLRSRLGRAARRRVELNFTADRMAETIEAFYRTVIRGA